ncbi:MAG: fused MFS/spermidine synthase [Candidatus Eisenbacteria bacterium]
MTAWRGNETSFGIVMTVWLLAGGVGSAAYGLVARRVAPTRGALARGLVALGVLAPAALLTARALRGAMGLTTGEVSGFAPLVLASLISLAPFTVVAGLIFALSTSIVHAESGSQTAAGKVYLVEAAGAACAGLLVSLLFLPRFDPVSIALMVTLLVCAVSVWLLVAAPRGDRRRPLGALVTGIVLAAASAALLGPAAGRLDDASVGAQWRDVGFLAQTNSIYGRIVAASMGSQMSIYESGVLAASAPDRKTAEETVHLPMLSHPGPSRVLLLGGGLGGAVREVLKHPSVSVVDYVELDPELIHTARRAFGEAMTEGFEDSRVSVHFADARFFVKRVETPYDVVIVGVPDPTTAQLNRFYTAEFMEEVSRALADEGVLGFSVQSAENYIGAELAALLACLRSTAESVFPAVSLYPGDPCHIVASPSGSSFTRDAHVLSERVRDRGLDVAYVRDYYLADRLSPERIAHLDSTLEGVPTLTNTDLSPAACYLSMVLWNRQFSSAPHVLLAARGYVTERNALLVALALVVVLAVPSLARGRSRRSRSRVIVAAVFLVGATEISLELTALLAFQSIYGYVYQELALIVAAFMAGLAFGGWLGTKAAARGAGAGSFLVLQLFISAVPLALGAALARVAALPPHHLLTWAALFPAIVVGAALLAGLQFPLAAKLVSQGRSDIGAIGGRLYGADLLGAAVGATGTAVFLLPIMGTLGAMRALAIMNAAVLVSLLPTMLPGRRGRDD